LYCGETAKSGPAPPPEQPLRIARKDEAMTNDGQGPPKREDRREAEISGVFIGFSNSRARLRESLAARERQ
jgi:hypothetical protein